MEKALADRIAKWIANQVKEAGLKGAVVGLSGGVDSAVAAALCKKGLGDGVLGALMPCESDPRDEEDAKTVAETLDLETITIRLDRPIHAFEDALPEGSAVARANLKARAVPAAESRASALHTPHNGKHLSQDLGNHT